MSVVVSLVKTTFLGISTNVTGTSISFHRFHSRSSTTRMYRLILKKQENQKLLVYRTKQEASDDFKYMKQF